MNFVFHRVEEESTMLARRMTNAYCPAGHMWGTTMVNDTMFLICEKLTEKQIHHVDTIEGTAWISFFMILVVWCIVMMN